MKYSSMRREHPKGRQLTKERKVSFNAEYRREGAKSRRVII
jgi:hypothetical protein